MTDLAQNALAAKRVGQYLIDAGVLTSEQLDEALDRQKRMSKAGFHVLLGTILEEMGAIDRQSLEAIILRQRLDEGSVHLGSEANWEPFRPKVEPPASSYYGHEYAAPTSVADEESQTATAEPEANIALPDAPEEGATDMTQTQTQPVDSAEYPPQTAVFHPLETSDETTSAYAEPQTPDQSYTQEEDTPGQAVDVAASAEVETGAASTDNEFETETFPQVTESAPDVTAEASASDTTDESTVEAAPSETTEEANPEASSWPPVATETPAWGQESNSEPSTSEEPVATWTYGEPAGPDTTPETSPEPTYETAANSYTPYQAPAPLAEDQWLASQTNEQPYPTGTYEVSGFRFSRRAQGLAETEVAAVVNQLTKRTRTLEDQIAEAKETLSHLDSMRRYGEESIKAADTIAEEIRSEAEKQSVAIRERAQQEARRIVAEARIKHDEIVRSAGEQAEQVSVEITRNIDEHREINRRLIERAEQMMNVDTSEDLD